MTPPPGWPPQGAPPGWPPPGVPPPWPMAPMPMYMPVYLPPARPLPARDRLLAAVLIGEAVLGPLAIIALIISTTGFGGGNGPGSLGFKAAGVMFAVFFLSIAAGPIVLRDLAGRAAPAAMGPLVVLTTVTLAALGVTVGVIFTTSGQQTPTTLPLATGLFAAAAGLLTVLNTLMIKARQTTMAVPALGVVFGAISLAGGLLTTLLMLSGFNNGGSGARIAAGLLIIFGFICYLIWAVTLGVVVLRRPFLQSGQAAP